MASGCDCGAAKELTEVLRVNKTWHKEYKALNERYKLLQEKYNKEVISRLNKEAGTCEDDLDEDERQHEMHGNSNNTTERINRNTTEDIEVFKQQLVVYKEDFNQEQQENEKVKKDNEILRKKLQENFQTIDLITKKKEAYKRYYDQVNREKNHIVQELKKLSMYSSTSATHEL